MDTIKVASIHNREGAEVGQVTALPDLENDELKFTVEISGSRGRRIAALLNNYARIQIQPSIHAMWVTTRNRPDFIVNIVDLRHVVLVMSNDQLSVKHFEPGWQQIADKHLQQLGPQSPWRQIVSEHNGTINADQIDWLERFEQAFIGTPPRQVDLSTSHIPVPIKREPELSVREKEQVREIVEEALKRYKLAH